MAEKHKPEATLKEGDCVYVLGQVTRIIGGDIMVKFEADDVSNVGSFSHPCRSYDVVRLTRSDLRSHHLHKTTTGKGG